MKVKETHTQNKLSHQSRWLFYLIVCLGVSISVMLWHALLLQSKTHLKRIIQLQTEYVSKDINTQLVLRISALKQLAKHLESYNEISETLWHEKITNFLNDYSGFETFAFLQPDLKIRWITPLLPSQDIPKYYNTFIHTFENPVKDSLTLRDKIWLSPVLKIDATQNGIFIVIPLVSNNVMKGYLVSTISLAELFNIKLNTNDYTLSIYAGTSSVFQFGDPGNKKSDVFTTPLSLYGTHWKIYAWPSQHLINTLRDYLPRLALIMGVLIALLLAIAFRLAQIAQNRTDSLQKINQDLKREIKERIEAENIKQKLEKKLMQGQKLQAIGTLAGGIAHDFNNIIYAIIGYVEMAQEDLDSNSLIYKNLCKVLEGAHRGQDLVARILNFSRRQQYDFKPIPLTATIQGVIDLLRPTIPASVTINFVVKISMESAVLGNETQLHQVLMNLINNSVDAMDGEGTINIYISRIHAEDDLFRHYPYIAPGEYYKIDVSDTGFGMDPSTIERIFEPFFTTKQVGKGTGLGLATVHAIVKEHNGEVIVNTKLGAGTTFTILLPVYSEQSTTTEKDHG